ncbi:hypothetical protein [Bosea beijingensis]|uniref:hypothetical protein n=1 Tax=Bosea beijingensis TaxID=3068632 RepID=UPI002741F161|nr:hypothetical protein [Bosea sp. REN20]
MQEIANSGAQIARGMLARAARTIVLGFAAEQLAKAISDAQTATSLDEMMRLVWRGLAEGALDDAAAEELSSRIEARRRPLSQNGPAPGKQPRPLSIFPPRRPQPSRRSAASLARRRQLVAAGPMPPRLAAHFTSAELAALMIIREEVRLRGTCTSFISEIAARAGVGRTTVQNATRRAAELGLITIQERRRPGQKNLTNVIRIVSQEWLAWIASWKAAKNGALIGFKSANPTGKGKKIGFPMGPNRVIAGVPRHPGRDKGSRQRPGSVRGAGSAV